MVDTHTGEGLRRATSLSHVDAKSNTVRGGGGGGQRGGVGGQRECPGGGGGGGETTTTRPSPPSGAPLLPPPPHSSTLSVYPQFAVILAMTTSSERRLTPRRVYG